MRRLRGLARCGGGLQEPPLSILALEPNLAQKSCFPERCLQFQLIWPFFRIFFPSLPQKNSENWNSTEKSLKMVKIFKICNFWAISTCNTSKKRIFHIEFIFKQKKYDLLEKKAKNFNFSIFFSKFILTSWLRLQIFQNFGKNFQNWVALFFGKVLKIKVTKGELVISNHVEMADQYLLGGLEEPPRTD